MTMLDKIPKNKDDFKPKKHHGFQFLIFLCGLLLPPIGQSEALWLELRISDDVLSRRRAVRSDGSRLLAECVPVYMWM